MKAEEINWCGGRVVFWDYDKISLALPADSQIDNLRNIWRRLNMEKIPF